MRSLIIIRKQREEHRNHRIPDWTPRWCGSCQGCGMAAMSGNFNELINWSDKHIKKGYRKCRTLQFLRLKDHSGG